MPTSGLQVYQDAHVTYSSLQAEHPYTVFLKITLCKVPACLASMRTQVQSLELTLFKPNMVLCAYNHSARKAEMKDSWGSLVFQAKHLRNDTQPRLSSDLHMHLHKHAAMNVIWKENLDKKGLKIFKANLKMQHRLFSNFPSYCCHPQL